MAAHDVAADRLPVWNRRRPELVYETEDHRLMAAPWSARGGSFAVGPARPWSQLRFGDTGVLPNFDLAPDGRVFALLPGLGGGEPEETLSMMVNAYFEAKLAKP